MQRILHWPLSWHSPWRICLHARCIQPVLYMYACRANLGSVQWHAYVLCTPSVCQSTHRWCTHNTYACIHCTEPSLAAWRTKIGSVPANLVPAYTDRTLLSCMHTCTIRAVYNVCVNNVPHTRFVSRKIHIHEARLTHCALEWWICMQRTPTQYVVNTLYWPHMALSVYRVCYFLVPHAHVVMYGIRQCNRIFLSGEIGAFFTEIFCQISVVILNSNLHYQIFKFVIDNSDISLNCLQHIQKRRNFDAKVTCHQPICLLLHDMLSGVGVHATPLRFAESKSGWEGYFHSVLVCWSRRASEKFKLHINSTWSQRCACQMAVEKVNAVLR